MDPTDVTPVQVKTDVPTPSSAVTPQTDGGELQIRIMALHALLYCERLFYLEEVEEIRVADAAVYAGRRLHDDITALDDELPEKRRVQVSSEKWGLSGVIDAVRRRDGIWIAYEHKRGRCMRGSDGAVLPWPSDRIQAIAYAVLLEEELQLPVPQARVRYHAENVTAIITIDDTARADLRSAIERAHELRRTELRPPVASNENLCRRCSLSVVCLPEEERLTTADDDAEQDASCETHAPAEEGSAVDLDIASDSSTADIPRPIPTLFPSRREKQTLHVVSHRARIGRSGESIVVTNETDTQRVPIEELDSLVVHGFAQVSTQAIHLCASRGVAIAWLSAGGRFLSGTSTSAGRVQQRIRQYQALIQPETRLRLAKQAILAKISFQLKYLLRTTRGDVGARAACEKAILQIRESLRQVNRVNNADSLRGFEGISAKAYFGSINSLLGNQVAPSLHPSGRSRHPPRDRFNAALSFGYALVQSLVLRTLVAIGLEPSFGFFHQPRSAAYPLVMDLMELFRTPLWEMPLIGSLNRGQWDPEIDFDVTTEHVWLSDSGRKKALELFENRLNESYKHPHTGQSLAYSRMVELEARLLEKEWTGCPGLFARLRLR